jgi:hypothetical protein
MERTGMTKGRNGVNNGRNGGEMEDLMFFYKNYFLPLRSFFSYKLLIK